MSVTWSRRWGDSRGEVNRSCVWVVGGLTTGMKGHIDRVHVVIIVLETFTVIDNRERGWFDQTS